MWKERRKGKKRGRKAEREEESLEKTLPLPSLQSFTDPFLLSTEEAVSPQSDSVSCKDTLT